MGRVDPPSLVWPVNCTGTSVPQACPLVGFGREEENGRVWVGSGFLLSGKRNNLKKDSNPATRNANGTTRAEEGRTLSSHSLHLSCLACAGWDGTG
jgi:hypothetical protein